MKANSLLKKLIKRTFKPKQRLSAADWIERNIYLDNRSTALAGLYRFSHTPYWRQLANLIDNPRVRKITIKKSAQVGATTLLANIILYYVCNANYPLLYVGATNESAKSFSERDLIPRFEKCEALQEFIPADSDLMKKTEFQFRSCTLKLTGAGSPQALASRPVAIALIDEADKHSDLGSFGEAPALSLIEARTISYPHDKKIFVVSTPTVETTSVISAEERKGSQHRYNVTCKHCQQQQVLEFKQVKWPSDVKDEEGIYDLDRVEAEAYYECIKCNARWTEADKVGLVRSGSWKQTNDKAPKDHFSCHISALYSFSVTWGALAKIFLLAKDDAGKLHDFYNSYLGECFEVQATSIKENDLDELIKISPDYQKGELLREPQLILAGVDVQQTKLFFGVCAFYKDGSTSLLDYGEASTFEDLYAITNQQYKVKDREEWYGIYKGVIDAGYSERKTEVLDFCLNTSLKFMPVLGRSARQGLLAPTRETVTPYKGVNIPTLHIDDGIWKNHLFIRMIQQRAGKLYLPQNAKYDKMLREHLTSERLVERNVNGKKVLEWVLRSRENHLADCMKYAIAYKSLFEQFLEASSQPAAPTQPVVQVVQQPTYQSAIGWD